MVDLAVSTVGRHGLQAPGAGSGAGLAVAASLPVLHLVLSAAIVDPENEDGSGYSDRFCNPRSI